MKILPTPYLELLAEQHGVTLPEDVDGGGYARLTRRTTPDGSWPPGRIPPDRVEMIFQVPLTTGEDAYVRLQMRPAEAQSIEWAGSIRDDAAPTVSVSPALMADVRSRDLDLDDLASYLLAVLVIAEGGEESTVVDARQYASTLRARSAKQLVEAWRRLHRLGWLVIHEATPYAISTVRVGLGPRSHGEPVDTDRLDEARRAIAEARAMEDYRDVDRIMLARQPAATTRRTR